MSEAATVGIVTSELRNRVKWIQFNRPEVKNAIAPESADLMRAELESAIDEGARVVVIGGSGGAFCSGADLKAVSPAMATFSGVRDVLVNHYHPLVIAMTKLPIPVIAAVDGAAAGIGSDIALAADIRLASDRAFFAEIFVNIALLPDGGGTFTLPRLVGSGRALEMAMTGARVPASDALAWGLVNHVYPVHEFHDCVQEFAEKLAHKAPLSLARSKQAIRRWLGTGTFEEALVLEADLQEELFSTDDFREGVMAFLREALPAIPGEVIAQRAVDYGLQFMAGEIVGLFFAPPRGPQRVAMCAFADASIGTAATTGKLYAGIERAC